MCNLRLKLVFIAVIAISDSWFHPVRGSKDTKNQALTATQMRKYNRILQLVNEGACQIEAISHF